MKFFSRIFKKQPYQPIFITTFLSELTESHSVDLFTFINTVENLRDQLAKLSGKSPFLFAPQDSLQLLLAKKIIYDDGDIEEFLFFIEDKFEVDLNPVFIMDKSLFELSLFIINKQKIP